MKSGSFGSVFISFITNEIIMTITQRQTIDTLTGDLIITPIRSLESLVEFSGGISSDSDQSMILARCKRAGITTSTRWILNRCVFVFDLI